MRMRMKMRSVAHEALLATPLIPVLILILFSLVFRKRKKTKMRRL